MSNIRLFLLVLLYLIAIGLSYFAIWLSYIAAFNAVKRRIIWIPNKAPIFLKIKDILKPIVCLILSFIIWGTMVFNINMSLFFIAIFIILCIVMYRKGHKKQERLSGYE